MKDDLKIEKGIIIPLDLLEDKNLKLKEVLSFAFIMQFNIDYFTNNIDRTGKDALPSYFINKNNLFKLIPLNKRTIKESLNNLLDLKYIKYYNHTGDITNLISYKSDYKIRGFIFIPIEILYNKNLNILEKFILSYIRGYSLNNKNFKIKTKDLSILFKVSKDSILRTLRNLESLNLIERNTEKNNRTININQLNIENYFENADIRKIKEAKINIVKEVKTIENINSVQNLTINIGFNDLKSLNKADLLSIKKELDNQFIDLINNKQSHINK